MVHFIRFILFFSAFSTPVFSQNLNQTKIICDSFFDKGQYKFALPFAEKCVALAKSDTCFRDTIYASMLHRLATTQFRLNQNEAAEVNYRAILKIKQTVYGENTAVCATSMYSLGNAVMGQDRLIEAQQIFLKSLQIRDFIKQKPNKTYAATLNSLGMIAIDLGNNSEAESYFQQTCDRYNAHSGDKTKEFALALGNLAQCNSHLGNYERALKLLRQSLQLREKVFGIEHPFYASALQGLGEFYLKTEKYTIGEPLILACIAIREKELGATHWETLNSMDLLATIFLETGRIDSAELLLREVIARHDTLEEATDVQRAGFLNSLGEVLLRKNELISAEKCFEKAVLLQEKRITEAADVYLQSLQELARTSFLLGKFDRAEVYYKMAQKREFEFLNVLFPHFSERERQIYFKPFALELERYATFANEAAVENPAIGGQLLDLRMATRGILFSASQKNREQFRRSGNLPNYEKWRQARERLANLMLEPPENAEKFGFTAAELNETIRMLEKKLGSESENFRQENEKTTFHWQDLRDALAPEEAAIEIIRFKKQGAIELNEVIYVGILVTREMTEQPLFFHFGDGNELETVIFDLYQSEIARYSPISARRNSPAFRNFWEPIEQHLGDKKRIFFALDGVFHKINLGTLRTMDGQFLSEKYDFRYLTNLSDLVSNRNSETSNNQKRVNVAPTTAILIGNPTFNLSGNFIKNPISESNSEVNLRTIELRPLPESETEVRDINHFFIEKGWNSQVFVQKNAIESVVKSVDSVTVLHIATHGFFLEKTKDSPQNDTIYIFKSPLLRSMLFFAGAENQLLRGQIDFSEKEQDGILTAYEVQNMSLEQTELVTLSACQTGLGDVESGEGVFGLQRAFQIAGAKSLLMSLWPVDDVATRLLMTVFYEKWLGGYSKIESLRIAEAAVRARFPEPAKWGGFVLIGK
jgi:CHAT domain-containing protein